MKDLKSINGLQKSPHATKYYLKGNKASRYQIARFKHSFSEISCNNTAKCQLAGNCFAPEGYDCICANAICSPRLTSKLIS